MAKDTKVQEKAPQQNAAPAQLTTEQLAAFIKQQVASAAAEMMGQLQEQLKNKATGLDQWAPAYIEAVKSCRNATKNAENPHLRNSYANLTAVLDVVKEGFLANDLWVMQFPGEISIKTGSSDPYIACHALVIHKSGQHVALKMELPAFAYESKKNGGGVLISAQTAGSAISYARRYMLAAIAGITQVDDDADAVSWQDGAEGPSDKPKMPPLVGATGPELHAEDTVLAKIAAAATFDGLLALRDEAQALKSKKVTDAYLARRLELKEKAA